MGVTASRVAADAVDKSEPTRARGEHAARLVWSDLAVVVFAVAAAQIVHIGGLDGATVVLPSRGDFGYCLISLGIVAAWMTSLWMLDARATDIVGSGAEEYARVASASFRLFGLIAIVAFLGRLEIARGYLAIAFPLGLIGLMLNRHRAASVRT